MMKTHRRAALSSFSGLAAAPLLLAAEPPSADAPASAVLAPKPLPFDATTLRGLSERGRTSHHDNNDVGAVKNLLKVREQLATTGSLRTRS
jgi:hypothetical protein